jgi:hypothetical protein
MSKRHWIALTGTGVALLLTSCASNRTKTQSKAPAPQAFAQPIAPAQPLTLPPVKIAGMIQTTDGKAPLMPVASGSDRDPFAAPSMPGDLKAVIQPAQPAKTIATRSIGTQRITPAPQPTVQLPIQLPQPAIRLNATPMPPISIGALPTVQPALPVLPPPMSRTNLAEAIAFSGVIQTGAKISAIVQDTDGTSRYVQMGESLAGGQVTVKRIDLDSTGNPSIVLLQNGIEFIKSVGGAAPI